MPRRLSVSFNFTRSRFLAPFTVALLLCGVVPLAAFSPGRSVAADNPIPEERGAFGLGLAIRRLGVVASVLHTGAHPDDEDSGLLAYLARGREARTAYLSLTRGDGGQNVIGSEINEPLGVIRTEELLAARRMDGAEQFFTRAFDFGFSKSRTETLEKWDREQVLADIVRVIRTFRPMVVVSAWSGTPNDGHGHHQASGLLTLEAYAAAADPKRFPEQIKQGLRAWQPKKLYTRSFDGAASPRDYLPSLSTLSINTGQYDPLLGRSYYELAAKGRSQHRSQDEGTIEARGPRFSRLRLIDSKPDNPSQQGSALAAREEKDIFDGIDTSVLGIAAYASHKDDQMRVSLEQVQADAQEAMAKYNPLTPTSIAKPVADGLRIIRALRARVHPSESMGDLPVSDEDLLLKQKEADFADALAKAYGLVVDCLSEEEVIIPGQSVTFTTTAYADASAKIAAVALSGPSGWDIVPGKQSSTSVDGRLVFQAESKITVPPDAEPDVPYWLKRPRRGDMFVVGPENVSQSHRVTLTGIEPVAPPEIFALVQLECSGETIRISQPAQYRSLDRSLGEIRRDVKVAPRVSVSMAPELLIYPFSSQWQERSVNVSVVNNAKEGSTGTVRLEAPEGWQVEPPTAPFDLKRKNQRAVLSFKVKLARADRESRQVVNAIAMVGGKEFRQGYQAISYPHIQSRFFYRASSTDAEIVDVKVTQPLKVGFIEGAGDDFANALKRIGVEVKTIDSPELQSGDLSVYDAIVAGVRVYEVRPDVVANNARLLDYVNRGGTYIVQYNRGDFETGGYAPYRISDPERQRAGQREREPRLIYVADSDIAGALAPKSTRAPKVGFIGSANDSVLSSMLKHGIDAKLIEPSELSSGDLTLYDVIVLGSDDSARTDVRQNNQRLLDYSRTKVVVVGYDRTQYERGKFPEYPKVLPRPLRTTDENAVVTILEPDHPRFNFPNKISARDFDNWIQERGAYFLSDWDAHFKPMMSCHDPGEPDLKGGEVIAEYGRGLYVYTAYAWFRQLPRGVPGAYRLIANLVSLPKANVRGGASR